MFWFVCFRNFEEIGMLEKLLGDVIVFVSLIGYFVEIVDSCVGGDLKDFYIVKLLFKGLLYCGKKIVEEGVEFVFVLVVEGRSESVVEVVDLIYYMLVGLCVKGVSLD